MVRIRRLLVEDFRCWGRWERDGLGEAPLVLCCGPNGVGKTSLLEAVSVLGGGKGLLGADAKAQVRDGAHGWRVFAELDDGTTLAVGWDGKVKTSLRDGKAVDNGALAEALPLVWLAPRLDRLFLDEPRVRRDWLDGWAALVDPAHGRAVEIWQRHKKARLKLLLDGADADWLGAEERLAAEWGVKVLRGRVSFAAALGGEGVALAWQGAALEVLDAADPVGALRGKLERSRPADLRMGRTCAGPDTAVLDGLVEVEGVKVKLSRASSGQHKLGLVRLLGAQAARVRAARGVAPLVVLDELGAHLDAARKEEALDGLLRAGCQIWGSDVVGVGGYEIVLAETMKEKV